MKSLDFWIPRFPGFRPTVFFITVADPDNLITEDVGLHVLVGPSMANLSLLRLLLLLNIVSASKLVSFFDSPWSLIQLSLGPLWGLTRLWFTQKQPHLNTVFENHRKSLNQHCEAKRASDTF